MDAGYPLHMERWRGVPENLDAATTWVDGGYLTIYLQSIVFEFEGFSLDFGDLKFSYTFSDDRV